MICCGFAFKIFFPLLQGEDNIEYYLGLTPSGIIVLRNRSKVGNYFWPRITKIYFKGKYFMLRVRDKNVSYKQLSEEKNYLSFCWKISRQPCLFLFQNEENTYGFETPSRQSCKHLWKCCVEHDAFFRLLQVSNKSHVPIKSSIICTRKNNNLHYVFTSRLIQVSTVRGCSASTPNLRTYHTNKSKKNLPRQWRKSNDNSLR